MPDSDGNPTPEELAAQTSADEEEIETGKNRLRRLQAERLAEAKRELQAKKDEAAAEGDILKVAQASAELERQRLEYVIKHASVEELINAAKEDGIKLTGTQEEQHRQVLQTLQAEKEAIQARNRLIQRGVGLGKKFQDTLKIPRTGMPELIEDFAKAGGKLGNMLEGVDKTKVAIRGFSTLLLETSAFAMKSFIGQGIKMAFAIDKVGAAFTAQTGITGRLRDAINETYQANLLHGISLEDASKAQSALLGGYSGFITLSHTAQETTRQEVALLEKLGLNAESSAKMINELTRSLGASVPESRATIRNITQLGIALGIPAETINNEFIQSLPKLRVYGDRATDVFRELTIAARETGTTVSGLIGVFSDQFNTFEGSATAAGKLNAVLGTDLFSSSELLMATESERMEIMRDRLSMAGIEFANMSKYQQMALANAAGISDVNEAAKIFGNTQSGIGLQIGDLAMSHQELEERAEAARDVQNKLSFAMQSMGQIIEPLLTNYLIPFLEWFSEVIIESPKMTKTIISGIGLIIGAFGLWHLAVKPVLRVKGALLSLVGKAPGILGAETASMATNTAVTDANTAAVARNNRVRRQRPGGGGGGGYGGGWGGGWGGGGGGFMGASGGGGASSLSYRTAPTGGPAPNTSLFTSSGLVNPTGTRVSPTPPPAGPTPIGPTPTPGGAVPPPSGTPPGRFAGLRGSFAGLRGSFAGAAASLRSGGWKLALREALKTRGAAVKGVFLKSLKGTGPIAALFEAFFAGSDFQRIAGSDIPRQEKEQQIGVRLLEALGRVGGAVVGGALGAPLSLIPGIGWIANLAMMTGGAHFGGMLTGALGKPDGIFGGAGGLGRAVISVWPGLSEKVASAQKGGITTAEGLVNVHPQEAIIPLDKLMDKFDDLIAALAGRPVEIALQLNGRTIQEELIVPTINRHLLQKTG